MSRETPFFSVVTIVLNDPEGFKRTAESVKCQSTADLEWIVIDGGSEKETLDTINQYRDIMTTLVSERDQGIYDAMNKGLRRATGEYVVFMNAGDEFAAPSSLGDVALGTSKSRDNGGNLPDLVLTGARLIFPQGETLYKAPRAPGYVKHSLPANHQSTFARTKLHQENEFPVSYRICGDYAAVAAMISGGASVLVLDLELAHRDTSLNSTAVKSRDRIYDECKKVQREILGLDEKTIFKSYVKRYINQEGRRMMTKLGSGKLGNMLLKALMAIVKPGRPKSATGGAKLFGTNESYVR